MSEQAIVEHMQETGLHRKGHKMKVDPKELALGIKIEMEHTTSKKVAREIALDHLHEDPQYYTHLEQMEEKHAKKSLMEGDMEKSGLALVIVPGELTKAAHMKGVNMGAATAKVTGSASHPAGLSGAGGNIKSPIPYEGHAERMKLAKMAGDRMLGRGATPSEDEGKVYDGGYVDRKGIEPDKKPPHNRYSKQVSGMGSQAHDMFGKQTIIVKPSELGSSTPEPTSAHTPPRKVRKPKS